jgi:predicted RNA-binding protein associated with RNAse of E/G family
LLRHGAAVALRYITTDGRIEMCWPCRVVVDEHDVLALFIAAGSRYKAGPKRTAADKRKTPGPRVPVNEYVWRKDTLRLMFPGRQHSVLLFWDGTGSERTFSRYFVNLEEPLRRTPIGVDTQDHTLDIDVTPGLDWNWRDEDEFASHLKHGFYTEALARAVRAEGTSVIEAISRRNHPCLAGWNRWQPDPAWNVPSLPADWDTAPVTHWEQRLWAYGPHALT